MTATAEQEVNSLDRVLTRLATTEESNLEKVRAEMGCGVVTSRIFTHRLCALRCASKDLYGFNSGRS